MHLAASTRSLAELDFAAACLQLQELGFDKVELCLGESANLLQPAAVAADPESLAVRIKDASRLSTVALMLEQEIDPETFSGVVRFAQLLRTTQITIKASPLGTPFNSEVDRLRERNEICHQSGVRLSILTEQGALTEDPHTAIEICQSSKGVGITLDPSAYICRPDGPVDFDVVFPHVLHVHLRDTSPTAMQVPTGLGEVDYNRIIAVLNQLEYSRSLSVDLLPGVFAGEDRLRELRKLHLLLNSML